MRGIICAGGHATRLRPLTNATNKHLLRVGNLPMIYYPILTLYHAGIDNILIVTGKDHAGHVIETLGNGRLYDDSGKAICEVNLTYRVQTEPGGIAQAIGLAKPFVPQGEKIVVILGDNLIGGNIIEAVRDFRAQYDGAKILFKEVDDPQRFGVGVLENDQLVAIEEKPKTPRSNFAVIGIYMYDYSVFWRIKNLKPSDRGELEVTDINNSYLGEGKLGYEFLSGWWCDAGTFSSLIRVEELIKTFGHNRKDPPSC